MTHLDAAVRQAMREDPRAAYELLADYDFAPEAATLLYNAKDMGVRWSHFVARIRDLAMSTRIEWVTGKTWIDWTFPYSVEKRGGEIVFTRIPTKPPVWVPD